MSSHGSIHDQDDAADIFGCMLLLLPVIAGCTALALYVILR